MLMLGMMTLGLPKTGMFYYLPFTAYVSIIRCQLVIMIECPQNRFYSSIINEFEYNSLARCYRKSLSK